MAIIVTTGPAHIFVGNSGEDASEWDYLGTCERSPQIQIQTLAEPVKNDIGGETPISMVMQGQTAEISGKLTRWEPEVLYWLLSGTWAASEPGQVGSSLMGGLGQRMDMDFNITFYFPFHKLFSNNDAPFPTSMPSGISFTSVVPKEITLNQLSTRAGTVDFKLRAIPRMTDIASDGSRAFRLYTHLSDTDPLLVELIGGIS